MLSEVATQSQLCSLIRLHTMLLCVISQCPIFVSLYLFYFSVNSVLFISSLLLLITNLLHSEISYFAVWHKKGYLISIFVCRRVRKRNQLRSLRQRLPHQLELEMTQIRMRMIAGRVSPLIMRKMWGERAMVGISLSPLTQTQQQQRLNHQTVYVRENQGKNNCKSIIIIQEICIPHNIITITQQAVSSHQQILLTVIHLHFCSSIATAHLICKLVFIYYAYQYTVALICVFRTDCSVFNFI